MRCLAKETLASLRVGSIGSTILPPCTNDKNRGSILDSQRKCTLLLSDDSSTIATSTQPLCKHTKCPSLESADHHNTSTPETFDMVTTTVNEAARKNLSQISTMLTQIAKGSLFGEDNLALGATNDFVGWAIAKFTAWFLEGILSFIENASVILMAFVVSCRCP